MSFATFYKRNQGLFNLAIVSNLEYRLNFFVDAILQPTLTSIIEVLLWVAVFAGANQAEVGGFSRDHYFSYAIWAAFFARISTSWMYESRMIEEIESGSVNGIIVRPISFYEYYFSQLMGYKFITTSISLIIPLLVVQYLNLPFDISRFPLALILCFYYLILVHSISFLISTMAFFFTRIQSLTVVKNLSLWILSGELIPLDLMPETMKKIVILLPFSNGVFIPVGYLTGRLDLSEVQNGFISITIGLVIVNILGILSWKKGLSTYAGTGA